MCAPTTPPGTTMPAWERTRSRRKSAAIRCGSGRAGASGCIPTPRAFATRSVSLPAPPGPRHRPAVPGKARYKVLVKQHHPDTHGGDKAAEEKLKLINQAYATLKASFFE